MGHRPTPDQEQQALRDATREAHEALQGLYDAIREANALTLTLVSSFEATHEREIKLLSNHLAAESNRISAQLNDQITTSKKMIMNEIMNGELVFDPATSTVRLQLGAVKFDDQQPLPYPDTTTKENHP